MAPHTRSRGPAAPPVPLESISPLHHHTRTPLTIRLPRTSNAKTPSSATNNAPVPPPSVPAPETPAPAPTPALVESAPSAQTPDQPVYTFPPPPPPPNVDTSASSPVVPLAPLLPLTIVVEAESSLNGRPNASPSLTPGAQASRPNLRHDYRSLAIAPEDDDTRTVGVLKTISPAPAETAMQYPAQPSAEPPEQPPTQLSFQSPAQYPGEPSPQPPAAVPNTDLEFDHYTPDPMDVDSEGVATAVDGANELTMRHREANRKYRQRLKERRQNGEIDEIEFAKRKERQRINSRNSRARRKARREAAREEGSISSDPQLVGPGVYPSADTTPVSSDFLLYSNGPTGPTTLHDIITQANGVNSGGANFNSNFNYYVPESISAPVQPASFHADPFRYASHPVIRTREFRDASVMTEPTKGSETTLDPIPHTLARHPHKQLTPERLHEFQTNPLELIDKAFLLILPDRGESLGKLILCRVIEHRMSSAGQRFLVQFWGDRTPIELSVEKMLQVLRGGYEIDPPSVDSEPQTSGLTGRFFGALRSFTGF